MYCLLAAVSVGNEIGLSKVHATAEQTSYFSEYNHTKQKYNNTEAKYKHSEPEYNHTEPENNHAEPDRY